PHGARRRLGDGRDGRDRRETGAADRGRTRRAAEPPWGNEPVTEVGVVIGTRDATPLQFWIGVREGCQVQLDDLIAVRAKTPDGVQEVCFYGLVDEVLKRYEGAQFDTDAFAVQDGLLPVEV